MRIVVDYLAEGKDYRSEQKVVHKEALIKLLRVLSGDEISMCELFDQYTRRGRAEVIPAMIRTCKRFHISYQDTADSIRRELKLPDSEIEENMKLYW